MDEVGTLPVGRIVAAEEQVWKGQAPASDELYRWGAVFGGVAGVLVLTAIGDIPFEETYYRYAIRIEGSGEIAVREEFFQYKVGDCVGLRIKPLLLVPALSSACK